MNNKQAEYLGRAVSWCKDALLLARKRAWINCYGINCISEGPHWSAIWLRDIRAIQDALDEIHGDYSI